MALRAGPTLAIPRRPVVYGLGGGESRHRSSVYLYGQPTDILGPLMTDNASPPRITATAGTRLVGTDGRVDSLCSSPVGFVRD